MKIFEKIKSPNGRRRIYFCGIKIFSYIKKTSTNIAIHIPASLGSYPVTKTLSFISPVYINDFNYLYNTLKHYDKMNYAVKRKFQFILIDDASRVPASLPKDINLNIRIYKILDDIDWNIPGARNLGAMCADTENIILLDLDHLLPEKTLEILTNHELGEKDVFMFDRFKDNKQHHPHPGTFFMKKSLFLKLHGCDEDFAGHYGSDGHLRACFKDYNCNIVQTDLRIDTFTKITYQHDLIRDTAHNEKVMAEKNKAPLKNHSKNMLRFRWEFVEESKFIYQEQEKENQDYQVC